jgi:hypothetical protein
MNINEVYPSKYLKAEDLQNREITVTMSHVEIEKIGQGEDRKPVLYFVGKEKGVALNKTNSTNIAAAFGPETDGWSGNKVILYVAWVDYQGKSVQAIRVRPALQNQQPRPMPPQQMAAPTPQGYANAAPDLSDEIPF